jgi:hypothetical protein
MWFGTQYGLNRYDGYNFKIFAHDPEDPNSLSGVYIRALFKDRDGTLWVGCNQFLNKFDPKTETFTRYPIPFVNQISQDSAGILWLATSTGLYALDRATGKIRRYSHDRFHGGARIVSDLFARLPYRSMGLSAFAGLRVTCECRKLPPVPPPRRAVINCTAAVISDTSEVVDES